MEGSPLHHQSEGGRVAGQSLFDLIPGVWQELLADLRGSINSIGINLGNKADAGERILPDRHFVFRALEIEPANLRVLILGQDPYPNAKDASGLAFSVPPRTSGLPGSLLNIQKEIITDIGSTTTSDGDLTRWANQGVMLLNRVLTVSAGASLSHAKQGWEEVTERIIKISAEAGVIGVLWGNSAKSLAHYFPEERLVTGVHPSPLSAHRGFLGSRPFSRVNAMLRAEGREEILW